MSMMNRLANVSNRFQTPAKRVLCVCSAGLLRSPTAANVLHQHYGYNTRAAGHSEEYALIVVDDVLLAWADEVVCVEQSVADALRNRFPMVIGDGSKLVVLDIPDCFEWQDKRLRMEIKKEYEQAVQRRTNESLTSERSSDPINQTDEE